MTLGKVLGTPVGSTVTVAPGVCSVVVGATISEVPKSMVVPGTAAGGVPVDVGGRAISVPFVG